MKKRGLIGCGAALTSSAEKSHVVAAYLSARLGQPERITLRVRLTSSLEPQGLSCPHFTGIVVEIAVAIRMYNGMPIVTL
jgi:hypothetical protein